MSLPEVAELFRDDAFASGDGDMELFLPAVHQRGKHFPNSPYFVLE